MRNRCRHTRECSLAAVMALAFLGASCLGVTGCQVFDALKPAKVAKGQDAVAVNAERTIRASFTLADNFVALDDANREALKAQAPAIHAAAEGLRATAPDKFRAAWAAVRAYEALPNVNNAKTLDEQLAAVDEIARAVRGYLNSLNAQGVTLKQPTGQAQAPGLPDVEKNPTP